MNGIDAVAVALGQDWRAIESAAHSYAAIDGKYLPLTQYWIEGNVFHGRIEMPISVGTQGGAIKSNPSYMNTIKILGNPNAIELSQIMLSVGLAQNFAALRALSIEGIQRGHMNLHARNVAIRGGVPTSLINDAVTFMKVRNRINEKAAMMYLKSHQMFLKSSLNNLDKKKKLSSFYVEIQQDFLPEPLILTILLDCKTQNGIEKTYHLSIEKEPNLTEQESLLSSYLFGGNKGYEWLNSFLGLL
jgi:hydroxymethylglutaryl-CoA synthase